MKLGELCPVTCLNLQSSKAVSNLCCALLSSVGLKNREVKGFHFLLCVVRMVNTVLKSSQSMMTCQLS